MTDNTGNGGIRVAMSLKAWLGLIGAIGGPIVLGIFYATSEYNRMNEKQNTNADQITKIWSEIDNMHKDSENTRESLRSGREYILKLIGDQGLQISGNNTENKVQTEDLNKIEQRIDRLYFQLSHLGNEVAKDEARMENQPWRTKSQSEQAPIRRNDE